MGLPFATVAVGEGWQEWPNLPDLFPTSFPGVKTSRDSFLVDIDLNRLEARVAELFNSEDTEPDEEGFVRYSYRPLDTRWLYWQAEGGLLDRPRTDYKPHVFGGNLWLVFQRAARPDSSPPLLTGYMGDLNQMNSGVHCVPAWLRDQGLALDGAGEQRRPNLTPAAQGYLDNIGMGVEDLFHHVLAVLHDPAYREANAGALRMEWPRIPLPGWPEGDAHRAAEELAVSAARGRELARLLDSETPVPGVTTGTLHPDIASIGVPATVDGHNMSGEDFSVTKGWGHFVTGDAVMPGRGRVDQRSYTTQELEALGGESETLGTSTVDVYLNDHAYWRNVPAAVWNYKLGGYQVLKKWLSYRERKVLGRALRPEEVQHFTDTARRIGRILMVTAGNGDKP